MLVNRVRELLSQGSIWPPIDVELVDAASRGLLRGTVLNAGAGLRDVRHLVDGTLVNQDLRWGPDDIRANIDIFSPLHVIPRQDDAFDAILCIAVLEHVENPEDVVREFRRVLRPGGHVMASVPFLQPEHKVPTDFQRYTQDGLCRLFSHVGFEIISVVPLFSVYHTLHWITYEWLHLRNTTLYKALRLALLPPLAVAARRSTLQSVKLASGFQVIARKPGAAA